MSRRALIICSVWPEPTSSAAGMRTLDLVRALRLGAWDVALCSPGRLNEYSQKLIDQGMVCESLPVNDSTFDRWVILFDPQVVIFDRFNLEEQFSWRVRQCCPAAVRILDTVDLHFLRRARQAAIQAGESLPLSSVGALTEDCLRELAAIYRSDLTWLLSDFEVNLLKNDFALPSSIELRVSRFAYPTAERSQLSFNDRAGFVMIGNFRHPPNMDAALWLRHHVWPKIRALLPGAQVDIYGAYPSKQAMELNSSAEGYHVKGWAADACATLGQYRVNLAPLRFGAGIKGKITDGWFAGTPVVTTSVGAEGMTEGLPLGGVLADDPDSIANAAIELYQNEDLWKSKQKAGYELMEQIFSEHLVLPAICADIERALSRRGERGAQNHFTEILWHQGLRSTEYFSRWIEAKNKTC